MVDGLKPGQRKIMFACFKRNLRSDIKVAQLAGAWHFVFLSEGVWAAPAMAVRSRSGLPGGQGGPPGAALPGQTTHAVSAALVPAGYVAEHSAYHHGEASLGATIVGLAQDFVGSNNINYLVPQGGPRGWGDRHAYSLLLLSMPTTPACQRPALAPLFCNRHLTPTAPRARLSPAGQFGTRLQGGKDAASPRYIFTRLAPLTRHLFNESDDRLLAYLNEEGQSIEPEWWATAVARALDPPPTPPPPHPTPPTRPPTAALTRPLA